MPLHALSLAKARLSVAQALHYDGGSTFNRHTRCEGYDDVLHAACGCTLQLFHVQVALYIQVNILYTIV